MRSCPSKRRLVPLHKADSRTPWLVATLVMPLHLGEKKRQAVLIRLSELGLFPGEPLRILGSFGPLGPIIVRAGDSTIALSSGLASSVLLRPAGPKT